MADAAGRKTGGRTKGTPNKKTLEKTAAIDAAINGVLDDLTPEQIAEMGPRDALLRVMRWALQARALPLFIDVATVLLPYMHAKKAPVAERDPDAPTASEIAADLDPDVMD